MSEGALAAFVALLAILFVGYPLGVEFPPCCPGAQRGCNVESGALGVAYCRQHGFGWERCQAFGGKEYPQALWRSE